MSSLLSSVGPSETPSTITKLIAWTVSLSLLSSLVQTIFDQFDIFPGPRIIFSLNWWGISQGYVWQLFTYLFIQDSSIKGINFTYLLSLFFNMYLLWVIGTDIIQMKGKGAFLRFYFFIGITIGIVAILLMPLTGKYAFLSGPSGILLALLTIWSMAFPENELLLFFLLPIKTKWIATGIITSVLLVTLSEWDLTYFIFYLTAVLFGYLYVAISWGWRTPFAFTSALDSKLTMLGLSLQKYIPRMKSKNKGSEKTKIVDLQTGKRLTADEEFIELMLSKISKHGESSLSWSEKKRMQQISERKKNH
jgi:membrane associated rhomboid family serine protease